jgi:ubiquinone/menaquinone biosynthesis C-methylase UbiE
MLVKIFKKIHSVFFQSEKINLLEYWDARSTQYGARSVLNVGHTQQEYDAVTNQQLKYLFPLLQSNLNGTEKTILDFGCGPGRFTKSLAALISGSAVGVDVTQTLLDIAPIADGVTYQHIVPNQPLPLYDNSIDVIWCCLVLGGIHNDDIGYTLNELNRVLANNGLMFLAENTSKIKNAAHWFFRSEKEYIRITQFCNLHVIGFYEDLGQRITVFCGRKVSQ